MGEFTPQFDLLALKYAGDGTLLWANTLDVQSGSIDESRSIALDGSGNVVIAGTAFTAYYDAVVWKLASNGQSLWSRVTGFEPGSGKSVAGLGIDALGNVTVAGTTGASAGLPQWFWAFLAADGTALSAVRLPSGASRDEMAAMTLAGESRGVAVGKRWNETDDALVASFIAPGGALQWSATGVSIGTETAVRWGSSSSEPTGQGFAVGVDGQVTLCGRGVRRRPLGRACGALGCGRLAAVAGGVDDTCRFELHGRCRARADRGCASGRRCQCRGPAKVGAGTPLRCAFRSERRNRVAA